MVGKLHINRTEAPGEVNKGVSVRAWWLFSHFQSMITYQNGRMIYEGLLCPPQPPTSEVFVDVGAFCDTVALNCNPPVEIEEREISDWNQS